MNEQDETRAVDDRAVDTVDDVFDEVELPDADVVTMGDASYTKMLGRIWA